MKKNSRKVIFVSLFLLLAVLLTGCKRTALTTDQFKEAIEKKEYEIQEITIEKVPDDSKSNHRSAVEGYAVNKYEDFTFIEYTDADAASDAFDFEKSDLEDLKDGVTSELSVNLPNYNKYELTVNKKYYVISRIEKTILRIEASSKDKKEIKSLLKELGYN